MREFCFVVCLIFSSFAMAHSSLGDCKSLPESKMYLETMQKKSTQSDFAQQYPTIAAKVQQLRDSANQQYFFCLIQCQGSQSLENIWVTLAESPQHFEQMDGFLCPAVQVESVQIVGSIYSPQPVAQPFSAFDSTLPELALWLNEQKLRLSENEYQMKWQHFSALLNQVGLAYVAANSEVFKKAGMILLEISARTPAGQNYLASVLGTMEQSNWEPSVDYSQAESLVLMQFKIYGRFLRFRPL